MNASRPFLDFKLLTSYLYLHITSGCFHCYSRPIKCLLLCQPTPFHQTQPKMAPITRTKSKSLATHTSTSIPETSAPSTAKSKKPTMATLPPELHLLISSFLTYPDALSLKHTSRHFYSLVYTGVNLKIEWLIERRRLHLDCPHDKKCELGSDMRFCRGSVRSVLPSSFFANSWNEANRK